MGKFQFRSDISKGIKEGKTGINKETGIIKGFAVISKGEAKGHGLMIDDTMLSQVIELGNKSTIGIKSRFGHPNMSSDALGTHLGRVTNFHKDGDIVRADLKLDKSAFSTPNGNLGQYVLDLAESDPDAFGASIVFSGTEQGQVNNDGTPMLDAEGNQLKPLARCEKLYAADVVDEPAANSGFFSETVQPSVEMTAFLDKLLMRPDAVQKIQTFLNRYFINTETENQKEAIMPEVIPQKPEEKPSDEVKPVAVVVDLEAAKAEALKVGITQERERLTAILADAEINKFSEFGLKNIINEGLKAGKTKEELLFSLKDAHYQQLLAEKNQPAGASSDKLESTKEDFSNLPLEKRAEKEWDAQPDLRSEFGELKAYVAYLKADANNQVKIFKVK